MNNIFKYATKELSQDAFLCWSIGWLCEGENNALYPYGKAMLDMFLGDKKQEHYCDVTVYRQHKHIDVLVLYKDTEGKSHALIIEDKTNTSEHDAQMQRYKEKLENDPKDKLLKEYPNPKIHLAYIKTGILYDEDACHSENGVVVVDLDVLLPVVSRFAVMDRSEILTQFHAHINDIKNHRLALEKLIENGRYEEALRDAYGQFLFLDRVFDSRKRIVLGNTYVNAEEEQTGKIGKPKSNPPIYADCIYAGTNNGGTPWTEYCFWGEKYSRNYLESNKNEYHYLFWRIDCKWERLNNSNDEYTPYYYVALRHYDEQARIKGSDENSPANKRKTEAYKAFRELAENIKPKKYAYLFENIRNGENYKESDLLFIRADKLQKLDLAEVKDLLKRITREFLAKTGEVSTAIMKNTTELCPRR